MTQWWGGATTNAMRLNQNIFCLNFCNSSFPSLSSCDSDNTTMRNSKGMSKRFIVPLNWLYYQLQRIIIPLLCHYDLLIHVYLCVKICAPIDSNCKFICTKIAFFFVIVFHFLVNDIRQKCLEKKWREVAWRRNCSWKFPFSEWLSLFEWSLTWRFMLFLNLKLKTVTLKRNKRQTYDLFLGRFGPIFLKKHFENVIRKQCACMTLLNWNKIFKNGNCLRILR